MHSANIRQTMVRAVLASVLCPLLWLSTHTRAQSSPDTSMTAVTAALAYVRPSSQGPPVPNTSSFATISNDAAQEPVFGQDNRKACGFPRTFNLTGKWSKSPSPTFHGYYNMTRDCPSFAHDFDCQTPGIPSITPEFIDSQYSQVYTPDDCALREFEAENFNNEMAGRRLLFLGDSLMRGNWGSLACLMRDQIVDGHSSTWGPTDTALANKTYTIQFGPDQKRNVTKQYVGEFTLKSGGKVIIRDHSYYSQELFDDIMSEWQPITDKDILVISYGGWYPRFGFDADDNQTCWIAWKDHVSDLFQNRLSKWPGIAIWKDYTPQHFGGPFGLHIGIEDWTGNFQYECQPANKGEYWYDDFVRDLLKNTCTDACKNIQLMPIYEMTRQRPYFHGGAFGRGKADGSADCKHFCNGMIDWWNVVLYNILW